MNKTWEFTVQGIDADGRTWIAEGTVICEFGDVFRFAMQQVFDRLTDGRAVFGHPGVGCTGPYNVQRVLIKQRGAS